jgi:four helix bundle protein
MIRSYKDFEVYSLSYSLAMAIFKLTRDFPKEELYSLTSQLVRSSRSISANIVEGWAKRTYPNKFKVHLIDALGSNAETQNWISFAKDCGNLTSDKFQTFNERIEQIGRMMTKLHQNWEAQLPTSNIQPPASNP